ncbi:MAG: ramA 3 [Chlorobi bacterium]|nr:ramA 3 [Chlorobiota bacterium]
MNIAAVQTAPIHGGIEENIERIASLTEGVRADLLVIPELASTGYFFTERSALAGLAESPEDGRFCRFIRSMAVGRGMVVVAGFAELAGEKLYNSALIALPDGSWSVYRKAHLFYKEKLVFEPGDSGFGVVEWNGVRIGTMICYDWRFPEAARALALAGADVIAHPSNLVAAASLWGPTMRTRALENKVIIVTANRCGAEEIGGEKLSFTGESRIISHNSTPLAMAGPDEETVITAEADPLATRNKAFNAYNDIFADRRPELYRA